MSELPPFIGLGGTVEYSPPIVVKGCRMYAFVMPADRAALDRAFHARFTEPSQGAVMAVSAAPFVMFYASVIPAITLRDNVGWYRERETGVLMFGVDLVTNRLFTTLDYLFVDSGQAMANGREIFGFPKHLGRLSPEGGWLDDPDSSRPTHGPEYLSMETLGVEKFGVDAWAAPTELWRLERSGDGLTSPLSGAAEAFNHASAAIRNSTPTSDTLIGSELRPFADMADGDPLGTSAPYYPPLGEGGSLSLDLHAYEPTDPLRQARMPLPPDRWAGLSFNLFEQLAQNELATLLLKQIRSATTPGRAAYSAILELEAARTMRSVGLLGGDYTLHVTEMDSAPMAETFGWHDPVQSLFSMYTEYDFVYSHGRTLWSAVAPVDG